ncbi:MULTISPECIES: flagellar protein FliT [Pseudomonas]|uniref:flagellar protein FliT n=1 Tax=Pseudomonas sp. NS1(2017) TaxID=2025658 RepID=UPI000BA23555|nr:flagellar protein FliT [Pseudomonas sp. NS1(2017)]ASV39949.1 flagellar protein FliT [Pseudomonas sp. NS1(2017)]
MSHALQRIDETREALIHAMADRDWDAIGELDIGCRDVIEQVLSEAPVDEDSLREKLESLLVVYQQLLEVTTGERQAIFEEMAQLKQAKSASKVYHLFG